jgi:hypothetical protein
MYVMCICLYIGGLIITNEGKKKEEDKVKLNFRVGRSIGDHEHIARNIRCQAPSNKMEIGQNHLESSVE